MDIFAPAHPSDTRTQNSIQSKNYCIQNNEQQYSKSGFFKIVSERQSRHTSFFFPHSNHFYDADYAADNGENVNYNCPNRTINNSTGDPKT